MPYCPNCGSYVSPGSNICSCGTTFGSYSTQDEEKREPTEFEIQNEKRRKEANKHWQMAKQLIEQERYLEAIECIDKTMEVSRSGFHNFDKAKTFYKAQMYGKAIEFFRKSLNGRFMGDDFVYEWMGDTFCELARYGDALNAYQKAIDIINEEYEWHVQNRIENRWLGPAESDLEKLKKERNERIKHVNEGIDYMKWLKNQPEWQVIDYSMDYDLLKEIGKDNLITIAGNAFYDRKEFAKGEGLNLIMEPENRYDRDAVAIYSKGRKVGYVANSYRTVCPLTSRASDITDFAHAEYLMMFYNKYHIAQIIRR